MRTDQSIINRYTVTAGVLSYSVTFPLFEPEDVLVMLSTDGGATERELSLGDDYSVSINGSQTGGTVTLKSGVAQAGNIIAFLSNVPYTQELDLSNVATIDVNATERQLDRTTQQIQQVRELATRHITVPATSSTKPDELLAEIFTAQRESIESAASAASSAAAAGASEQGAASYLAQTQQAKTEAVAAIQAQQSVSESAVEQAGDAQAVRLEELASNILVSGTAYNKEATIILDQPITAGTVISLPVADDGQQMMYRVGASTLRMGFNGTLLFEGEQFDEVGNTGSLSTSVKLLFDAKVGDVLNFFVHAQNVTVVVDEASGLSIDDQKRLSAAGVKAAADAAQSSADNALAQVMEFLALLEEKLNKNGDTVDGTLSFSKNIAIEKSSDDSYLRINGSKTNDRGAAIMLHGANESSRPGFVRLLAFDKTGSYSQVQLSPAGGLQHDGKDIAVIDARNLASSGYYKFKGGITAQWYIGSIAGSSAGTTVTLPTAFTSTNYVAVPVETSTGATLGVTGHTTTSCKVRIDASGSRNVRILFIGY